METSFLQKLARPNASHADGTGIREPVKALASLKTSVLALAREVLRIEAREVEALAQRLDDQFVRAVELILQCRGRVVVSGMGKSGHIGGKIASSLVSTGTLAFFMHPADASHGDLVGALNMHDLLIAKVV